MYQQALMEKERISGGRGRLPYRILVEELRKQERIERNHERKETLQTLILLCLGIIELQEKADNLGLLLEKLIP